VKKLLILASKRGFNSHLHSLTKEVNNVAGNIFIAEEEAYTNLRYSIINGRARIFSRTNKSDLKNYNVVFFRKWQRTPEQATACALYLKKFNVRFIDTELSRFRSYSKLTEYFKLWSEKLPVPNTFFGNHNAIRQFLKEGNFTFPVILKDTFSNKGKYNFLAHSYEEVSALLTENKNKRFIVQEFIPNTFDYRILVLGYKARIVIKRERTDPESHLNNTTLGGKATLIDVKDVDESIINDAQKAAKSYRREVAGVDIVLDSEKDTHYILEVNNAPQISTGAFAEEKMKEFASYLREELKAY